MKTQLVNVAIVLSVLFFDASHGEKRTRRRDSKKREEHKGSSIQINTKHFFGCLFWFAAVLFTKNYSRDVT